MAQDLEERLIEIETVLAVQEKFIDDLNQVVIEPVSYTHLTLPTTF